MSNNDILEAMRQLETNLKTEIQSLKTELKAEIHQSLKTELKTEIQSLKTELKTEVQSVKTELKTDIGDLKSHMTNLFRATLSGTPASVLHATKIPIVKENDAQYLTGAALGKDGFGSSTWTYVKRIVQSKDGHEKEIFYAMSCAHCALNYKTEGRLQFVAIPPELKNFVTHVCLLGGEGSFATSYANERGRDIIFLRLSHLPPELDDHSDKVLLWDDYVTQHPNDFHGTTVAGVNLKSQIIGRNAAFEDNYSGTFFNFRKPTHVARWHAILDSRPEEADSGTAMVCFTEESGSDYVLAESGEEKQKHKPRLMGVYTGLTSAYDIKLRKRASICPIRPFSDFAEYARETNPPNQIKMWGEGDKSTQTWTNKDRTTPTLFVCGSGEHERHLYGVLINYPHQFRPPVARRPKSDRVR